MVGKEQWAFLLKIARERNLNASIILRELIEKFRGEIANGK